MKGMQAHKGAVVIAREFHTQFIANLKVFHLCKSEQEHTDPLQKYSIGLPWNINGPVPMELHGGSMVSAIKNPWEYHGLFMVNSIDLPWIFDNRP